MVKALEKINYQSATNDTCTTIENSSDSKYIANICLFDFIHEFSVIFPACYIDFEIFLQFHFKLDFTTIMLLFEENLFLFDF